MFLIADTSIWIDHLRRTNTNLISLLLEKRVLVHSVIIGELACGNLPNRKSFLNDIKLLPKAFEPTTEEVFELIEKKRLYGKGLGFADAQLIASAHFSGAFLWTLDKRLKNVIGKH